MKTLFLRSILVLVLCYCPLAAMAEWKKVIDEPFNSQTSNPVSIAGWTFSQCTVLNRLDGNYAIRVGQTSYDGSATTPVLHVSGDATLDFDYALPTNYEASLRVSIIGGGSISGTTNYTPHSKNYTHATLNIVDATPSTQIVFNGYAAGIALDNVVVYGNAVATAPAAPSFAPGEDYFREPFSLAMNCETEEATIYYTLDGTGPTSESTAYTTPITISETTTVKAVAYKDGVASEVTTARYFVVNYLFADAFTTETNGYNNLATTYELLDKTIGRSAILTFRMQGRNNSNNSLTLGTKASYQNNWTTEELQPAKGEWTTVTRPIALLQDGATFSLRLSSENCNIDDVLLVTPPMVTLDETADDNGQVLTGCTGQVVDVATRRTLRAGIWNTLCLPFNVTRLVLNTAFGEVQQTLMTRYTAYENDVMTFSSVGDQEVIPAGEPFLLKIEKQSVNPTFRAVEIATTTPSAVTHNGVTLQGIFNKTALLTGGSDMFIGTDNYLYVPAQGSNTMNGLRAYIHRTNNARISLDIDDVTVAVEHLNGADRPQVVYTLQGQRTVAPRRGIYVVEGRKVIIK